MKNFDWEEFSDNDIVVHCDTETKANDFLKQAHSQGFRWSEKKSLLEENYYGKYSDGTCYRVWSNYPKNLSYESMSYYQRNNYLIIEWETDLANNDLAIGLMVEPLEYPGDYGIVMPYKGKKIIVLDCGEFVDVNDITVKRVWGEASNGAYALQCLRIDRELLYERKESGN